VSRKRRTSWGAWIGPRKGVLDRRAIMLRGVREASFFPPLNDIEAQLLLAKFRFDATNMGGHK